MTSDLIAQIRINLESVEIAARSCREMSGTDAQAIYDRVQAMIELLESMRDLLVRSGQARPVPDASEGRPLRRLCRAHPSRHREGPGREDDGLGGCQAFRVDGPDPPAARDRPL